MEGCVISYLATFRYKSCIIKQIFEISFRPLPLDQCALWGEEFFFGQRGDKINPTLGWVNEWGLR